MRHLFQPERLDLFWSFIAERQAIYHRRFVLRQPLPWTDDPILQHQRFTNVYRLLDPGTQYVVNTILELDAPKPDKVFNVMLYRLIGRSDTHAYLGFQLLATFDAVTLENRLKRYRDVEGKKPFTSAYMVSGYTHMGSRDKVENVARLFGALHTDFGALYAGIDSANSTEAVYNVLRTPYGFGNFLAYQVLVDLLYPLKVYNQHALLPFSPDEWASAGPGAHRGIKMLLRPDAKIEDLAVMRWLHAQQHEAFTDLGVEFKYLRDADGATIPLSLADIQNCLCEYHKYVKISEGTGRGRRRFAPSS